MGGLSAATHAMRLVAAVMASGAVSALCRERVTCVHHRETLSQATFCRAPSDFSKNSNYSDITLGEQRLRRPRQRYELD